MTMTPTLRDVHPDKLYRTAFAAAVLDIEEPTVRQRIRDGRLEAIASGEGCGRRYRILGQTIRLAVGAELVDADRKAASTGSVIAESRKRQRRMKATKKKAAKVAAELTTKGQR